MIGARPTAPAARRLAVALATVTVVGAACTGSGDGEESAETGSSTTTEAATTTTVAPVYYGLVPNVALGTDQCWAEIPATTTTTSTTALPADGAETTTTTDPDTVPETLPPTVTTVPQAPLIGVVDCAGTHEGQAYATFCLVPAVDEAGERTGELTSGVCGGVADGVEWPGDRTVRRTAARICLEQFTLVFAEGYEDSALVAREFTPTEGIWDRGERRVVCTVDRPPDDDSPDE